MNKVLVVFLLILISAAIFTGCQPASPSPAPAVPSQSPPATPPAAATQTPQTPPPLPLTTPPNTTPTPQPTAESPLQIKVELEDGRHTVPIGIIVNAKYSTNRSANVTMVTALPDGSVINHLTKDITSPGSYVYPLRVARPIGERTITMTAIGTDGQTATATWKYWAGSVSGDPDIP